MLYLLKGQPQTSPQLKEAIRTNFGLHVSPLIFHSSLRSLKKQGYLKISATIDRYGYTKFYYLTEKGSNLLLSAETSLWLSCQNL